MCSQPRTRATPALCLKACLLPQMAPTARYRRSSTPLRPCQQRCWAHIPPCPCLEACGRPGQLRWGLPSRCCARLAEEPNTGPSKQKAAGANPQFITSTRLHAGHLCVAWCRPCWCRGRRGPSRTWNGFHAAMGHAAADQPVAREPVLPTLWRGHDPNVPAALQFRWISSGRRLSCVSFDGTGVSNLPLLPFICLQPPTCTRTSTTCMPPAKQLSCCCVVACLTLQRCQPHGYACSSSSRQWVRCRQ